MSDVTQGEAGEKPEAEPTVDGITAKDYALWRNHPVTLMFRKHLRDRRRDFIAGATDQWMAGTLELSTSHELRGFAKCLGEVESMPFENIVQFYRDEAAIAAAEAEPAAGSDAEDDDDKQG